MFATALLVALQLSGSAASPAPTTTAADIDALIARLPVVGHEATWDAAQETWVTRPDVALMQAYVATHALSDAQWERALKCTDVVRWRPRWPARPPFAIGMQSPHWIGLARITMTPCVSGWSAAKVGATRYGMCGNSPEYDREGPLYQELGLLTEDQREIVFDVLVEQGVSWHESLAFGVDTSKPREPPRVEGAVLWRGNVTLPVWSVESSDAVLPAVRSTQVDEVLRRSIGMEFRRVARESDTEAIFRLQIIDPAEGDLASTALSLVVEVVCDGDVRESAVLLVEAPCAASEDVPAVYFERSFAWAQFRSLPSALVEHPEQRAAWSVRLRGSPDGALRCWNARRRWDGEVTIPLAELLDRSEKH